jgi:hypothetical protein
VHPTKTAAWTKRRVELFLAYNLPSILRQTYSDFLYVVLLDPALRHLTGPMLPKTNDPRVIYCYDDGPTLKRLRGHGEIVLALIDSDDMYARTAGALMMACPTEWMYFKRGYALEARNGNLHAYDTRGSGPFFAHRIDPRSMSCFDRNKLHPPHQTVINYRPAMLADGQFCVVLHDRNTSSNPRMHFVLGLVKSGNILTQEFGLRR